MAVMFICLVIDFPVLAASSDQEIRYTLLDLGSLDRKNDEVTIPIVDKSEMLIQLPSLNLIIENQSIRLDLSKHVKETIGKSIECDGFSKKCFIFFDYFKLALGNDFSFEKQSNWEWQNFQYVATVKRDISIMGRKIHAVEVFGRTLGENPLFVTFMISPDVGVFYLYFDTGGAVYTYILDSDKGLWAPN